MVVIHWGWLDATMCVAMSLVAMTVGATPCVIQSGAVVAKPQDAWPR